MSTTPTELLETTAAAIEETLAAVETTAAAIAAEDTIDIASIKELMDGFDPAALLPQLSGLFGSLETVCRVAVLIGPVVLLVMGLAYLLLSPKEANYYFGYRTYFGMGSVHAWRFAQRMAGVTLGGLGLVLTAVMYFISTGFGGMDVMDMVWKAVDCLIWEAVLALLAHVVISLSAFLLFDRKGVYRKSKRK